MTKKTKGKEAWENKLHEDLCKRWKERREKYEKEEEETTQSREQFSIEDRDVEVACQQKTIMSENKKALYKELATRSLQESNDTLLLPSVEVDVPEMNIGLPSNLTGINRVAVSSAIQLERQKTKKALRQAQYYRNLSETLRTEKCQIEHSSRMKVALVRDFWRNKIKEGSTRAGKMVMKALSK